MIGPQPFISVVIPVKNGAHLLPACLASLRAQRYPADRIEVVVADGRSTDATREIAAALGARVVDNPREIVAAGRNAGFAASGGDLIAFTDDDCTMDPDWLANAVAHFRDPSVGGIGGPTLVPDDESTFGRAVAFLFRLGVVLSGSVHRERVDRARPVDDLPGCNAFYRRAALEAVMPTSEDLLTGDDVELNFRVRQAGFRLWSVPDVAVCHYKRPTPRRLWRQMYRFAIGRLQVGRRDRRMIRPAHVVAGCALPLAIAAVAAAALAGPRSLATVTSITSLALLAATALARIETRSWRISARVPAVLAIAIAAWSLGFMREALWPVAAVRGADIGEHRS